jgi:cyclic pyranopterin phosphate synthase
VAGELNHFDGRGNAVMADVGDKRVSAREAVAKGRICFNREALVVLKSGDSKKGDVLGAARIAGIMAVKKTSDVIPLCHPLLIDRCGVDFALDEEACSVTAVCTVALRGKTGAEMEALMGVTTALLTIYDMCKAVDRGMMLEGIHLAEKSGGKSGRFTRGDVP